LLADFHGHAMTWEAAMRSILLARAATVLAAALLVACEQREPETEPAGEYKSPKTRALEAGAVMLQGDAPQEAMNVHLVGFHPLKLDPQHQLEAHHMCNQVNEDFAQCALFDGSTGDANLIGVEYIISERLFETLPEEEREYWHPHNYEILSGQLIAPGIPQVAEHELMEDKMNSYGKTWHTWHTQDNELPLGEPALAWSFNRDGEARPELVSDRDRTLDVDTREIRERRRDLLHLAQPQEGVDAIKDAFENTQSIEGVEEKQH
jgi:hypothetical protein